jgi:hypothetical protein
MYILTTNNISQMINLSGWVFLQSSAESTTEQTYQIRHQL